MPEKAKPVAGRRRASKNYTVSNWKPLEKGGLRGFLTITLPSGFVLNNCQLLETNGQRWIGLPSQRFQLRSGLTGYVPIVEFTTKKARQKFQTEALGAVERYLAELSYAL